LLEDPCVLAPDESFRKLQQDSPLPILVDFGCTSLRDAHLFKEQGARMLSVKPGRFGLSHSRAMQKLMQQNGGSAVVGLMGESAAGTLAGLQFAATIASPSFPAEMTWFLAMTEQIVGEVPRISNGSLKLPGSPSIAALIDWKVLNLLSGR
jgi:L-alanine-DL-glutamate epimerase-like enolase superfamily enzyme